MAVATAALALTVVFFYRVALSDELLLRRDMLRVVLPLKAYLVERIRAGHFPDWYPYDGLGEPFAGMVVGGVFHPGNLLFFVLPAGRALTWNALLSFPVMAAGIWALLRRFDISMSGCALGAVLGTFNGFTVGITNSLPYLQALAMVPWSLVATLHFFARPGLGRATLAGLALALVLFAGDVEGFLVACTLTVPLALLAPSRLSTPARGVALLLMLGVTALVAAPQLVAALHAFLQCSARERGLENALSWSMHPLRLIELALGPLFGTGRLARNSNLTQSLLHGAFGGLWVESVHIGAVGLLLAVVGLLSLRSRRLQAAAVVVGVFGLLMALGKYGGVYRAIYSALPIWRAFRYPEKLVTYVLLLLSVLAAIGLDAAQRNERMRRSVRGASLALALVVALLALGEAQALVFSRLCQWVAGGVLTLDVGEALHRNFLLSCALSAIGLLTLALTTRLQNKTLRAWAVPAVCFLIAFISCQNLYAGTSPKVLQETPSTVQWLLQQDGPPHLGSPRVYSVIQNRTLPPSDGRSFEDLSQESVLIGLEPAITELYGYESANAYLPATSRRLQVLRNSEGFSKPLAGLFGGAYVTANEWDFRLGSNDSSLVLDRDEAFHVLLLSNPNVKPRIQLRQPVCVQSYEEALRRTTDPTFDFDSDAIVECGQLKMPATGGREDSVGTARLVSYEAEQVEFAVEAVAPAVLFLADAYYTGWTATVDGRPTPVLPTNVAGKGVLVEPGSHRVTFLYRTPGLHLALGLSLGILLLGAVAGLFAIRERARSSREAHPSS